MIALSMAIDVETQHDTEPDLEEELLVHLQTVTRSVTFPGRELEPIVHRT